jgi:hypothetical protein
MNGEIIELRGICGLCMLPIEPGESVVTISETGQEVHAKCYAESQEPQRNQSY